MLNLEKKAKSEGFRFCAGVDEAGRGPLAGPVVAAAVVLKTYTFSNNINDSKLLTPRQREKAFHEIMDKSCVGVGVMSESVVDSHNILEATYLSMNNAIRDCVEKLTTASRHYKNGGHSPLLLLVDGNRFKTDLPFPYKTIVKGDTKSMSIACASIVAKVIRDRILDIYHRIYPGYGFTQHKGYPTLQHRQAIKTLGLSRFHRKSFRVQA